MADEQGEGRDAAGEVVSFLQMGRVRVGGGEVLRLFTEVCQGGQSGTCGRQRKGWPWQCGK